MIKRQFESTPNEVSEVRPIQRRREPKLVPPKNLEEMQRHRHEEVQARKPERLQGRELTRVAMETKWSTNKAHSVLEDIRNEEMPMVQPLILDYIGKLTDIREEFEATIARMNKLPKDAVTAEMFFDVRSGLLETEDALHTLHKQLMGDSE